jgi:hypothetical protein
LCFSSTLRSSDGAEVLVHHDPGAQLDAGTVVEVCGQVQGDLSVRQFQATTFASAFSMLFVRRHTEMHTRHIHTIHRARSIICTPVCLPTGDLFLCPFRVDMENYDAMVRLSQNYGDIFKGP